MTKPTKPTKKQRDKKRRMTYEQAVSFFMAFFRGENADILVKKADVSDGYFYSVISELRKGVNTYATRAAVESFFRVGGDFRAARKPLTEEEVNTWQIMVGIKPEKVAKKPQPKTQKKPQKGKNPKVNRLPIRPVPSIRYFEKDGKIMVEETMVETRPATIEELTKLAIHSL